MTPAEVLLALGVLVFTSYAAALHLALLRTNAGALRQAFEERGRGGQGSWLVGRRTGLEHAVAFVRTLGRIGFFAAVLLASPPEELDAFVHPWRIAAILLGSALALWLFTSVLSSSIARHAGTGLIAWSAPFLRVLHIIARPVTFLSDPIDEAVRRLVGAATPHEAAEEELLQTIEETERRGGLDVVSARILQNVLQFSGQPVSGVMTPRTEIEGIAYTDDLDAVRKAALRVGHSRIPVFVGSLDSIVGILYLRDLLPHLGGASEGFVLRTLLRQPIRVPESKPVQELLREFQRSEVHMAIVVDEFGGTAGLATIEDALEEIVGEIVDEHEPQGDQPPSAAEEKPGAWVVDGALRASDFARLSGIELPEEAAYDTVAGLVLEHLGRVPRAAESFERHGARWTVAEATPTRIARLRVELLAQPNSSPRKVEAR